MQKINKIVVSLLGGLVGLALFVSSAHAATIVQIQTLPGYINYTDFKLSCTSNGTNAQFYSKKDGGSYVAFGPAINLTVNQCLVQVNGYQFGSEGKFWFEVIVDGVSSETAVTLDTTAPGSVSDFGKDRMAGGTTYKIHWKNPLDSDYTKVIIYRGTVAGFNADDSHRLVEAGGNPGDTMTWDDNGLDPTVEYYYNIRAIDHAGNSSGLVGDTGATVQVLGASSAPVSGKVTVLPKEKGTGSVLGTKVTPTPSATASPIATGVSATATSSGFGNWISTHKLISFGVVLVLIVIGYLLFRKKST